MSKYDALIAEAEEAALDWLDCDNSEEADLLNRLATALREAQAHVPPEGWRVTEYKNNDCESCVFLDENTWYSDELLADDGCLLSYTTAAAAMAAIEEMK